MKKYRNPLLKEYARELRNNMTPEERHLWYDCLKHLPITVHRQRRFGYYILDFYCPKRKIAIELDGSQHYEPEALEYDKKRDAYLSEHGIKVLRYSNEDIRHHFGAVCEDVERWLLGG